LAKQFTLGKEERLKSRKLTEELFGSGKSFAVFPLRVFYKIIDQPQWKFPVQAGVSVSGKNFKNAVDRNRIKRLLREAYRLQKTHLYECCRSKQKQLAVFFIYTDKTLPDQSLISSKMAVILKKLEAIINEVPA
jgi:ribonuclease P protein component